MSVNTDSMIRNILDRVSRIGYVKPEDIPNIDLYMDQVTTFMEAQLAHSKRYEEEALFKRTPAGSDLYLLFQKYFIDQRYPNSARTTDR